MSKEDTKTNYRIEYPENPDFDLIDSVCLEGLMEQYPSPKEEEAKGVINSLRASQFSTLYDSDKNLVGLIYFRIFGEEGYVVIDFLYSKIKRKGIGSILLQNLIDSIKNYKFDEIRLEVSSTDERAKAFYIAKGFGKVGEEKKSGTLTLDQMELKI